jgi:hypothetical protein
METRICGGKLLSCLKLAICYLMSFSYIKILPTDRKIYVIAKMEGAGKASVQIDNFELTDVRDHRVC